MRFFFFFYILHRPSFINHKRFKTYIGITRFSFTLSNAVIIFILIKKFNMKIIIRIRLDSECSEECVLQRRGFFSRKTLFRLIKTLRFFFTKYLKRCAISSRWSSTRHMFTIILNSSSYRSLNWFFFFFGKQFAPYLETYRFLSGGT